MNRLPRRLVSPRGVLAVVLLCAALLAACSTEPETVVEPTPAPTTGRGGTLTAVASSAKIATPTLSVTSTPEPTPTASITPFQFPTFPPTITPFVFPTSPAQPTTALMGLIQTCTNRSLTGQPGLYILQIQPAPGLAWDTTPHMFHVTLCNATNPPNTPSGQLRVWIYFPGSDRGHVESGTVQAQLPPGLSEVAVGPWVPGLENHLSACAMRPTAQIEVRWNDTPLLWLDGKTSLNLPIACGGTFS